MSTKKIPIRYRLAFLALAAVSLAAAGVADRYFEVSRNLDIFASIFRQVNRVYVDSVGSDILMKKGVDAMLQSLDPYTSYIPATEADDYRTVTTGSYGGIGSTIRFKDNYVCIGEPYAGFAAQKAGLRGGDVILELDGKSMYGKKTADLSRLLKGKAGTSVKLLVRRTGEAHPLTYTLIREEIHVKNVPFAGMVHGDIGYIRLQGFTEKAGTEVRDALRSLDKQGPVAGLILDLRGNPGGLLNEAVNIVNLFVDRGVDVVSTRGRVEEWNKTYKAVNLPENDSIPLVVLVNGSSASASEIVAGALQDLDRAVIIGRRTFGKGLVQSTRPLSYNAQLKITTSRYYIPSGRCIQAIDYSRRDAAGAATAVSDSMRRSFATHNKRAVLDGGGIAPDVATNDDDKNNVVARLRDGGILFDYATEYRNTHATLPPAGEFQLNEKEFELFCTYAAAHASDFNSETQKELLRVKKAAVADSTYSAIAAACEALQKKLADRQKEELLNAKEDIRQKLSEEITARYYYQEGRIRASLTGDDDIAVAVKILHDTANYSALLGRSQKTVDEAKTGNPPGGK